MITFKNRYAEFDNLDDSYNKNVLRNCYNREYRRNFFNYNRSNANRIGSTRNQNFNDIRLSNNGYQRPNSFTPFNQLPIINNNSMNFNNNDQYQQQNNLRSRSISNLPSIISYNQNNMNHIGTPFPGYNSNFRNNNESGFISNNYDTNNISNDNIQFSNENNILNISNDSQFNQENNFPNYNQIIIRRNMDNELEELEREKKLILDQEKLNQIDFELRYLRQKRNNDLQRYLKEQQQNLNYINKIKEAELINIYNNNNNNNNKIIPRNDNNALRRVNYNYRISNYRNNSNNRYNNIYLEEKLKSNVMNDKYYMNELIDQINRMKISQQESNMQFQRKMEDLVKQNDSIKMANQKMIERIKDMKFALSEKKNNENNYDDYIKERNNSLRQRKLFENNKYENNSKSVNYNDNNKINDNNSNNFKSLDIKTIEENNNKYNNYFLGKKDKDVEEFNMLNQNLVSKSSKVPVTPLLYDSNSAKYTINFEPNKNFDGDYNKNKNFTIGNDYSSTRKENLYSLIRKNNDRLNQIREIEEKN